MFNPVAVNALVLSLSVLRGNFFSLNLLDFCWVKNSFAFAANNIFFLFLGELIGSVFLGNFFDGIACSSSCKTLATSYDFTSPYISSIFYQFLWKTGTVVEDPTYSDWELEKCRLERGF